MTAAAITHDAELDVDRDAERDVLASGIRNRVLLLLFALVIGATAALSYVSHAVLERELAPEVTGKASAVAAELADDVRRALDLGIPMDDLVGVVAHFERVRARHPEMESIALLDQEGRATRLAGAGLYLADPTQTLNDALETNSGGQRPGRAVEPVMHGSAIAGHVVIGIADGFVQSYLEDLAFDVLVILLVALLVCYEVLVRLTAGAFAPAQGIVALIQRCAAGDLGVRLRYRTRDEMGRVAQRCDAMLDAVHERYRHLAARIGETTAGEARRLISDVGRSLGLDRPARILKTASATTVDARLPLFIFVFAEELQKSFLPLYVAELERNFAWISAEILVGLPISIYMLALAVATPISGTWVDRLGARQVFLIGLLPAIAGFVGCALATTVLELLLARTATAVGYAMITIAAQGYMAQAAGRQKRTQGMSTFIGVLMAASICGTAVGGILADRVGYRAVFLLAAIVALFAGICALRMLVGWRQPSDAVDRPRIRLRDLRLLLSNRRFVGLVLLAAIPAKVLLTGFLFYAVPLYLFELGATEAETGRTMMAYSIVIIAVGSWTAWLADLSGKKWQMVLAGGTVSGLAMLLLGVGEGHAVVLAAVVALALGHALSISPQIALVPEICRDEIAKLGQTTILGLLRTFERAGSVVGPIVVAVAVSHFGFVDGLAMVGLATAVMSLALVVVFAERRRS